MAITHRQQTLAEGVAWGLFLVLSAAWVALNWYLPDESGAYHLFWAATYQSVALWGGLVGLAAARTGGGLHSVVGRAITFLALGLLFQVAGQSVFSFYNIVLYVEIPYPSIADIGFFGSIPFYAYGVFSLGKAAGIRFSLKSLASKIKFLVVPIVLLSFSYYSFLREYEAEALDTLRVFLDFAYPLGQAFYISLALLVYLLCKEFLGGVMKSKVRLILFALAVQYAADYNFLHQAINGTWFNGGYGDYIYLVAYFVMAIGLIRIGTVFSHHEMTKKAKQARV